ncbi:thermonuclease family protein [Novosphingobium colocasiae]
MHRTSPPRAWCDYDLGYRSRDALSALIATGPVRIDRSGRDRYGRTLATVTVNGRDAGEYLIARGLARRW